MKLTLDLTETLNNGETIMVGREIDFAEHTEEELFEAVEQACTSMMRHMAALKKLSPKQNNL